MFVSRFYRRIFLNSTVIKVSLTQNLNDVSLSNNACFRIQPTVINPEKKDQIGFSSCS